MAPHAPNVSSFFADIDTTGLPSSSSKAQPWKEFHRPVHTLQQSGSIVVDMVPKRGEEDRADGYPLTLAVPPKKAAAAAQAVQPKAKKEDNTETLQN